MSTKQKNRHHGQAGSKSLFFLYGNHAVEAALQNPERVKIRLVTLKEKAESESFSKLATLAKESHLKPEFTDRATLDKFLPQGAVHQGIALEVKPLEPLALDDLIRQTDSQKTSLVVILDGVTDPHNIGAILRSAAAFDAAAVILQDKNAPAESATMAKSASGALDIVPLVKATNLSRTLAALKAAGFWTIGMEGTATKTLKDLPALDKIAIIMGSEGEGMRRLTEESCDFLVKLPISPKMESLNVSAAAAITLYELRGFQKLDLRKNQ